MQDPEQACANATSYAGSTQAASASSASAQNSPNLDPRPSFRHHWSSVSGTGSDISTSRGDPETIWTPVIARVSAHTVKLEREYNYYNSIMKLADTECQNTVRPLGLCRLPTANNEKDNLLVAVYESPGPNYLRDLVHFGPAFYGLSNRRSSTDGTPGEQVPVQTFLDFAIGSCECLELLHHGVKAVHGEIRADAFHFNHETGIVKLANTGNGPRSFENLLSSEGWSILSRELGVKHKLQVKVSHARL